MSLSRERWRFALLAPWMLWQSALVRRRTLRLPPAADRHGRCGEQSDALELVGVGDSIIAGIGVRTHCHSLVGRTAARLSEASARTINWRALGFSGLTLRGAVERLLPQVPAADVYLVSAGVNDAIDGTSSADFEHCLRAMVGTLRARSPHCRIVFAGIPPFSSFPALPWPLSAYLEVRGRALQSSAQRVAAELGIACHAFSGRIDPGDFAIDGFHPGPTGCDRWAVALVRLLVNAAP